MAIGDRNWDGSQVVRRLSPQGGNIWEPAFFHDVIEYQMAGNGGARVATAQLNGWSRSPNGVVVNFPGTLEIAGDELPNLSTPIQFGFDISATAQGSVGESITPNIRDASGTLTYIGYEPDAHNTLYLAFSGNSYTTAGAVMADAPWVRFSMNIGSDLSQNRYSIVFKPTDDSNYGPDGWWHVYKFDDQKGKNPFNFTKSFSTLQSLETGDCRFSNGSSMATHIAIHRAVNLGLGNVYTLKVTFLAVASLTNTLTAAFEPGFSSIAPALTAVERVFVNEVAVVAGKIIGRMAFMNGNKLELPSASEIQTLKAQVTTVRGDLTTLDRRIADVSALTFKLSSLDPVTSQLIPPNKPTWILNNWRLHKEATNIQLPATVAELDEAWLTENKFEVVGGQAVVDDDGNEIFVSSTDLAGVALPAGSSLELGMWIKPDGSVVNYHVVNGKWVENVTVDVPAQRTEAEIITLAKQAAKEIGAVLTEADTAIRTSIETLATRVQTTEILLNKKKAVQLNRSPVSSDIYEEGIIWEDVSFGTATPLRFVSLGKGAWQHLNQIQLTKIRFYVSGRNTGYRSTLSSIRIYKTDKNVIPNSWFVWGASSGIIAPSAGVVYKGQGISCNYQSGWFELEVSGLFDSAISIGRVIGNFNPDGAYVSCGTVEFFYSNGGKKTYSGGSWQQDVDKIVCDVSPALVCRFGDVVAAALGEILTAAKLVDPEGIDAGGLTGAAFVAAWNRLNLPNATSLAALEARKEVKNEFIASVIVTGETLPDLQARASGFSNNGSGDVAGATSWNAWAAIGVDVSQSGLTTDEYEISAAFPAAAIFGEISFSVSGVRRKITRTGLEAGDIDVTEWTSGDWHGATLRVTGDFTGDVSFVGFNGSAYIGPVIRRKRVDGLSIEGQNLALKKDIPQAPNLTGYATKSELVPIVEGLAEVQARGVPDLSKYALVKDLPEIPAAPDLTGLASKAELETEATDRSKADTALDQRIAGLGNILDLHADATQTSMEAEAKVRADADTALGGRIDAITQTPPAFILGQANAGIALTFGPFKVRIPSGGNRSLQMASGTGADISLRIQNLHNGGGSGAGIISLTLVAAGTFSYINSTWNFGNAGDSQDIIIEDVTNSRRFRLRAEIGGGYNNNSFGGYEIK